MKDGKRKQRRAHEGEGEGEETLRTMTTAEATAPPAPTRCAWTNERGRRHGSTGAHLGPDLASPPPDEAVLKAASPMRRRAGRLRCSPLGGVLKGAGWCGANHMPCLGPPCRPPQRPPRRDISDDTTTAPQQPGSDAAWGQQPPQRPMAAPTPPGFGIQPGSTQTRVCCNSDGRICYKWGGARAWTPPEWQGGDERLGRPPPRQRHASYVRARAMLSQRLAHNSSPAAPTHLGTTLASRGQSVHRRANLPHDTDDQLSTATAGHAHIECIFRRLRPPSRTSAPRNASRSCCSHSPTADAHFLPDEVAIRENPSANGCPITRRPARLSSSKLAHTVCAGQHAMAVMATRRTSLAANRSKQSKK